MFTTRNAFSKAVKRMQDGKSPQLDAPEPQSGRDPSLLETWQFEHGVLGFSPHSPCSVVPVSQLACVAGRLTRFASSAKAAARRR